MPTRTFFVVVVEVCVLALLGSCRPAQTEIGERTLAPPPHVAGTVAEYAALTGVGELLVQGYGVVVGLGTNGSFSVPPGLEEYFKQYLQKHGLGSWSAGTDAVSPTKFLNDRDTAVVLLRGEVRAGGPKGSHFDVFVTAIAGTQARSVAGGVLMQSEMRLAVGAVAVPGGPTKQWAKASGPVFVNPFLDPTKPAELVKFQQGRIIGGGTLLEARPVRLRLRQPDRSRCVQIRNKINERFPGLQQVANALNPGVIELKIPPEYHRRPEYFLRLVTHLPLRSGPASMERQAREIAEAMSSSSAAHDDLALIWEAMGREVVPIVQSLYASKNPPTAFYAARTGLRLRDEMAMEVILRFAGGSEPGLQVQAIEELGRHPTLLRAVSVLRRLVEDPNEVIRVAAYEALLQHGDRQTVTRIDVSGRFKLDLVNSHRGYVIYATQTQEPKIVLFGKDVAVAKPIFLRTPDDMVTINARTADKKLSVFRKIPRSGRYSDVLEVDFLVRSLVLALGDKPEMDAHGNFKGLGLPYGQVVSVLYKMCQRRDIPAKFVLQQLPDVQRIYERASIFGRPDMPGE